MFKIVDATWLAQDVKRLRIEAMRIARKQQAGQFVIVRVHDRGERIPLTIAESDPVAGTITLIVQGIGKTTRLLNTLEAGDIVRDVVGPLGNPSEVQRYGTVAVVSGGVGAAIAYPTARALRAAGNFVLAILGARSRNLLILEAEMRQVCDELLVTTDDGSSGRQGLVSDALRDWLAAGGRLDFVLAIGPVPMMRSIADLTRPLGIPTKVSLNSIMVDGTGMCGGCRVLVGQETRFACVDGPEFDAKDVDFDVLAQRNAMYRDAERRSLEAFREHPDDDLQRVQQQCRLAERHPEVAALSPIIPSQEATVEFHERTE